jgi:hypothetical protein
MRQLAESIAPLRHGWRSFQLGARLGALALVLQVTPSAAQELPPVRYQAAPGCPVRAVFEQRVRARVHASELPGAPSLTVRLQQVAGRALGEISLHEGRATVARRQIEAATCAEALEAVAFVAALLLEQHAAKHKPAGARPSPPARSGRVPSRAGAPDEPDVQARSPVNPSPPAGEPAVRQGAPGSEPALSELTDQGAQAASGGPAERAPTAGVAVPEREPLPARRAESDRAVERRPASFIAPPDRRGVANPLRARLGAAALLVAGVAPRPWPGLALDGGFARALGPLQGALSIGLRATLPQRERADEGSALFSWWSASAAMCGGSPDAAAVSAELCLTGETGQLTGRGERTLDARTKRVPWFAVGPVAQLAWRLSSRLSLAAGATLLVPLRDDRFQIAGQTLHRVPQLTYRAALGVRLHFE